MKPFSKILFLAMPWLCVSCGSGHPQGNREDECAYTVSHNAAEEGRVGVTAAKIIPLVTEGDAMLSGINKFIASSGDMFLLDSRMQSIYLFDSIGRQKALIHRQGAGPGEYVYVGDMAVDEQANLYVADIGAQRVIRYDAPDYAAYTVYPVGRAFTSLDCSDGWLYLSNVAEDKDLKIKLASRTLESDSLNVLSRAAFDNEYMAAGGSATHLWNSGNSQLYYDRFTPYIYRLADGEARKYIELDAADIPDESLVNDLINLPDSQRYKAMTEPTDKIMDVGSCYETDRYVMMELRTVPMKFVLIDKETGKTYQLPRLLTAGINSSLGLVGVYGNYFVTATLAKDDQNPQIALLEITDYLK